MLWIFNAPVLRITVVEDERHYLTVHRGLPCPEGDRANRAVTSRMDVITIDSWRILDSKLGYWRCDDSTMDDCRGIHGSYFTHECESTSCGTLDQYADWITHAY